MSSALNRWLDMLVTQSLPLLPNTQAKLRALMEQSQLSVTEYRKPILYDPGFSLQLLKKSNTDRKSAGRGPLTTLGNVLSHLGQGQLQQQLAQATLFDSMSLADNNRQGYLRYVAQACHGSLQARDWAMTRQTHEPEEMQLGALLQNIAELALWCYGGKVMEQIEYQAQVKKLDYDKAANKVLGCTTRALSAALAEAWNLPELVAQGLNSTYQDFTLGTGVALSARLARLSASSWYDKSAQECIQAIARYTGKAEGEIERIVHLNAVASSDIFVELAYASPARLLPMLVDENYIDPAYDILTAKDEPQTQPLTPARQTVNAAVKSRTSTEAEKVTPVSKDRTSVAAKSSGSAAVNKTVTEETKVVIGSDKQPASTAAIKQAKKSPVNSNEDLNSQVKKIQQMVKAKVHAKDLIQQVVDTINTAGLQRVVFSVRVPQHKLLLGRFYAQDDNVPLLENFQILLDKPHLFNRLLEKSQHIWLSDGNREKFWNLISAKTKLLLNTDNFFAMSVFSNDHCVGLMYADKIKGKLTADDYKKFQALCRMLSRGMVEIATSKQPAN
ncbi:MAG: HDOD domain-containing protein [Gammaproteobacteria bacterium]|nr:HDOD domain-containing protein [Gammaproteobacteria bacterium]